MKKTMKLMIFFALFITIFCITQQSEANAQGSISGKVFDNNQQPVQQMEVVALNFQTFQFERSVVTDTNGEYTILDIPAGQYIVGTDGGDSNFVNTFFNNVPNISQASPVAVLNQQTTLDIDFVLAEGGSISGSVMDINNQPIAGMDVFVVDFATDQFVRSAITETNGSYKIPGIPIGSYKVGVDVFGTNFTEEYFDNVTVPNLATVVSVQTNIETQNINFVLEEGGSISGSVLGSNGNPIFNIFVAADEFSTGRFVRGEITDSSGNYKITGLPAGTYRVQTNAGQAGFSDEFFDNVTDSASATPINVVVGNDTPNINFVLDSGGSISGRVVDSNNQPIPNIFINAEDFTNGSFINGASTDADGNYTIFGLKEGSYRITTNTDGTSFTNEIFDNVTNFDQATPVTVTAGNNTPNINFILEQGGSISGFVFDSNNQPIPEGINVVVTDFATDDFIDDVRTNANGFYLVSGIPSGTYRVRTDITSGNFTNMFFDNVTNFDLATPVPVVAGQEAPNINFTLIAGGSISGFVLNSQNQPIVGVNVDAFDFAGDFIVAGAQTEVDGGYTISGLPAGTYRVRTNAENTSFINKFYNNVLTPDTASPVNVTVSNNTPNINFVLEQGGAISGNVVDSNNQPIAGIHVDIITFDTDIWTNAAETDDQGNYLVTGLPAGNYRVRTNAENTVFTNEYFDDVIDFESATAVAVTIGNTTTDINFVLESGGSISGIVLDEQNRPIVGINVDANDSTSFFHVGAGSTDSTGRYAITGLPSGDYIVRTNAIDTAFTNKFYDDVIDETLATPVNVIAPNDTPDINFVLESGGSISGNVRDINNNPLPNFFVSAEDFNGQFEVSRAITAASGNYIITGLPSGTYRVGVDIFDTDFLPQFFSNASRDSALPVNVNAPNNTPSIDFVLVKGNIITGRVAESNNTPIFDMSVDAFDADTNQFINAGITNTNGIYSISVPPGRYKVAVSTFETKFLPQFYDKTSTFEDATIITVTAGQDAVNIDFLLSTGSIIKGKVTDNNNTPIKGLFINVLDSVTDDWINGGETDINGDYLVPVLSGTYNVQVETAGTNFGPALKENVVVAPDAAEVDVSFILSQANSVTGKVTNASGVPLSDMFVIILDATNDNFINFGTTDSNGIYSIPLLPGSYFVEVDTFGTKFVQPAKKAITVVANEDVTGVDFILLQGNVISGKVTDSSGIPIKDIFVSVFEFNTGFWVGGDATNTQGEYKVPMLGGTYKIGVDTFDTNFAPVMYNGKGWDDADEVVVINGNDTIGINFTLSPAAVITGTVRDEAGNPLSNIFIDVSDFETSFWVSFAETNADGVYRALVAPGRYAVNTVARERGFADKFYDNKTSFDNADPVELLTEGETVAGIDFVLTQGGAISGRVTDGASGISGVEVSAFDFDTDFWINAGITDSDGNYVINGLPTDEYRVRANDLSGNFPGEFFDGGNGVLLWNMATPVSTTNNQETTGINFTLSGGGSVSGVVTDGSTGIEGMVVEAFEFNTGFWVNDTDSDSEGKYSLTSPAGEFRLRTFDPEGNLPSEYFNDVSNWNEADAVTVVVGQNQDEINFALSSASFISGEVKDDKNKLLKGVSIEVFDFETDDWIHSTLSDQNGKYSIPVRPGKYRVGAIPFDPTLTPLFFNSVVGNVTSWDDASPVTVTDLNNAKNINFRLLKGGIIAGRVKDNSGNGIPKIGVQAFDFETDSWANENFTDLNGNFSVSVPQGKYRIWASPMDTTSSLSSEFYNDKSDWDGANVIDVVNEQTVTLNDIVLTNGNSIAGTVINGSTSLPLVGVNVEVYNYDTDSWINFAVTNKDGNYIVRGVQSGDYRVQAIPPENSNIVPLFFENTENWDNAKRITVASSNLNNIDFTLFSGGLITGRVIDDDSEETVCGIEIDAYNVSNNSWVNNDITDGNGSYSMIVPVGTYFIRATASGTDFVDELFEDAIQREDAKPVVVTNDKSANVNFRLSKGGKIAGFVKDSASAPIAGAEVNALDFDTNAWINNSVTNSLGEFSINAPSGNYRLYIQAPFDSNFIDEFFDDTINFDETTAVSVTTPEPTNVTDIVLAEGRGTIKGTVNGVVASETIALEGVKISVLEFETDIRFGFGFTNSTGLYSISLPPGKYRLFTTFNGTTTPFINEFYDNVITAGSATAITVSNSSTETADFTLSTGKSIKGKVRSAKDLTPLAGVDVVAFQSDTAEYVQNVKTDTNGNYIIIVPNGTYRVWASPNNITLNDDKFKPIFFNNTDSFDKATNVNVNNSDKTNINFDLEVKQLTN